MAPEKYPETRPKNRRIEEERAELEQERIARELFEDRIAAGLPPERVVEMTPMQRSAAEAEKAALMEAIKPLPKKTTLIPEPA